MRDVLFENLLEAVGKGAELAGVIFGFVGFEGDFDGFKEGLVEEVGLFVFVDDFADEGFDFFDFVFAADAVVQVHVLYYKNNF